MGCGAAIWFAYLSALMDWLGVVFGVLVAVVFFPGVVVFPLVFWLVEGFFPTTYVLLWVIGMVCLVAAVRA